MAGRTLGPCRRTKYSQQMVSADIGTLLEGQWKLVEKAIVGSFYTENHDTKFGRFMKTCLEFHFIYFSFLLANKNTERIKARKSEND